MSRPEDRYLDVSLPDSFRLDILKPGSGWLTWGLFKAQHFARCEDGSYVCAGHGGSPVWIRCIREHDDHIEVLDGNGAAATYRLSPDVHHP